MSAPEILSTGSCVPTQVVTNEMLAQRVDTSDEWGFSRTGIHSHEHDVGKLVHLRQLARHWNVPV